MRNRSQRKIIMYCLMGALLLTTVGYALMQATLNINGTVVKQKGEWSIYFDNIKIISPASDYTGDHISLNIDPLANSGTSINFNAKLTKPGDEVSFTVDVVNAGTVDAVLEDIILTKQAQIETEDIIYTFNYSDGVSVTKGDTLLAKTSRKLLVSVKYDIEATIPPETDNTITLGATLRYLQTLDETEGEGSGGGSGDSGNTGNTYKDPILAGSDPNLLNNSLVPVVYDSTKNNGAGAWVVADTTTEWYNYSTGQWANAVILESGVTKNVGDTVTVPTATSTSTEVKAMYVWVPRYEYKIEGTYGKGGTAALPGAIDVRFISTNQTSASSGYILHPAFQWDKDSNGIISASENISGIWVGKFETTGSENTPTVLPNLQSLRYQNVSNQFTTAQKFSTYLTNGTNTDSHMMKNSEWGAVAYLSQSAYGKYGNSMYTSANKEVYKNDSSSYYTGRSSGIPSETGSSSAGTCHYDDITDRGSGTGACGAGASTTGNIYGVYDMAGGADEYVMGYLEYEYINDSTSIYDVSGDNTWGSYQSYRNVAIPINPADPAIVEVTRTNLSGFSVAPASKYYNAYTTTTNTTGCNGGICYGQALSETAGWYGDNASFALETHPWFLRGGVASDTTESGVFTSWVTTGIQGTNASFRAVLIEEPTSTSSGSTTYTDPILAGSDPNLLNNSLVPVIYDSTKNNGAGAWIVADTTTEWYNYSEHQWANAVILESGVTKNVGDTVIVPTSTSTTTEVKAMYVWIPRYEYKITGTYGTHTDGTAGTAALPGAIDVRFISTSTTSASSGYILHPAFTWDNDSNGTIANNEHISGIWVGKFETSAATSSTCYTSESTTNCTNDNVTPYIIPNVKSLRYQNVSNQFKTAQKFSTYLTNSTNTDSHMMKNSEWGAVTYLSQSIYGKYGNSMYTGTNKQVYVNNSDSYYTGRSGGSSDETATATGTCYYDDITDRGSGTGACGAGASTTGNIYGVYDMAQGSAEYVMGVYNNSVFGSGFTELPDSKYYNNYTTTTISTACNNGICYGHALSEVSDWDNLIFSLGVVSYWYYRGGWASSTGMIRPINGAAVPWNSFRSVLIEA